MKTVAYIPWKQLQVIEVLACLHYLVLRGALTVLGTVLAVKALASVPFDRIDAHIQWTRTVGPQSSGSDLATTAGQRNLPHGPDQGVSFIRDAPCLMETASRQKVLRCIRLIGASSTGSVLSYVCLTVRLNARRRCRFREAKSGERGAPRLLELGL